MWLSVLSKFISTLLTTALMGLVITTTLHQTVMNSQYLEGKMTQVDGYNRLSVALSDEASQRVPEAVRPMAAEKLRTILTPEVLRVKVNTALEQLQAYYNGNGPRPTIDLTDLASQIQAAGIPLPENSGITSPIHLAGGQDAPKSGNTFAAVQNGMLVSVLVLTLALLAVCWQRRKWVALPNVLIATGILLGVVALIFAAMSGVVVHAINVDTDAAAITLLVRDIASAITSDLAKRVGIIAAVVGAVGIGSRILVGRLTISSPGLPGRGPGPESTSPIIS
jgi:hypothetical protein